MNENPRIVDISYTVKESEAAGRRLMKDIDSGKTFWVMDESGSAEDVPAPPPEIKKRTRGPKKK